jgi:thiamine-monophosphate kinase
MSPTDENKTSIGKLGKYGLIEHISSKFKPENKSTVNGIGDDFEMLFTVSLDHYDKVKSLDSVKMIGHVTTPGSGYYLVGADGTEVELAAQGWIKNK